MRFYTTTLKLTPTERHLLDLVVRRGVWLSLSDLFRFLLLQQAEASGIEAPLIDQAREERRHVREILRRPPGYKRRPKSPRPGPVGGL